MEYCTIESLEVAEKLFDLANDFQCQKVLTHVRHYMLSHIAYENVHKYHFLASKHNDEELLEKCMSVFGAYVAKNTTKSKIEIPKLIEYDQLTIEKVYENGELGNAMKKFKAEILKEPDLYLKYGKSFGLIDYLGDEIQDIKQQILPNQPNIFCNANAASNIFTFTQRSGSPLFSQNRSQCFEPFNFTPKTKPEKPFP